MVMLEAAAVFLLLGVLIFGAITYLTARPRRPAPPVTGGRWRAGHYEAGDVTRVVVQKVSAGGADVLDEHVVAELRRDDPEFDTRFLDAMSTARQRQSLFDAEEG